MKSGGDSGTTSDPRAREEGRDGHLYIAVGKILGPWGRKGEVRIKVLSEAPERFTRGKGYYLKPPSPDGLPPTGTAPPDLRFLRLESARETRKGLVARFDGLSDRQQARTLSGFYLVIPETELDPLPADRFYTYQLLGLKVYSAKGRYIGEIIDVFPTGSNDVFVISDMDGGSDQVLIPATREVVRDVDLAGKRMVVNLLPGLLEEG